MSASIPFIPGLELGEIFYNDAVRPILEQSFPGLPYAAGRLDGGSDVLGFDTSQSTDHGWGPRISLFLPDAEYAAHRDEISQILSRRLPPSIRGYPTHFSDADLARASMEAAPGGPIRHGVEIHTVGSFFLGYLGLDPRVGIATGDWLTLYEQRLRTIADGRIFHDDPGELTRTRRLVRYYPHDIWLYLLACQWRRISQEEPFMARCGDAGDELGSRLVAGRLVWEVMRLGFLMERTYAPYTKWFGTAFARLSCGPALVPILESVLTATSWRERETHLCAAYERMAAMHNDLAMTEPIPTGTSPFYDRPYRVIHAGRFVEALVGIIQDPEVRRLPLTGSANQFVDSTDVLDPHGRLRRLKVMFE